METIELDRLTKQELKELIERANQQLKVINQAERDKVAKEIIELISEKNRLGKPIYTKNDVAKLTGVSPSTVTKVIMNDINRKKMKMSNDDNNT
jgi:DNA invertase Pin-like site-specific DNA recombinase